MTLARLAVDIGGTFTDLVLEHGSGRVTAKVLTTAAAPEQGVIAGITALLGRAGLAGEAIDVLVHGTTLATNALIERKGARTAFITTAGFRDVLAMGNESRYDQYDLGIRLPEPLVPRSLRLPVPERMNSAGQPLLPLDERALRAWLPALEREGVQSLAVGFLHSFTNPAHEYRARDILAVTGLPISLSCEVSPEMREWERFSTTVANAYVQPLMQGYLRRLEAALLGMGLNAPLLLMLSGGGLTTIDTACQFPIRLVESGPAGGAIFAGAVAREAGLHKVLAFDMGGTTAKVCLIDEGQPQASRSFEVARVGRFKRGSGLPLRIPVIDLVEIGAGGGSLVHVDALKRIAVGPASAGAEPGPACYGRGGVLPAVTDANLVIGRYDPICFAGGSLTLDVTAARVALDLAVAGPLGVDCDTAAAGVVDAVDETMANAARMHAIESGASLSERTLVAFGGGGPVHATRLAEKLGISRVLVPPGAGVGSAIGFLRAPVAYEVVRSYHQQMAAFDAPAADALLEAMAVAAAAVVARGTSGAATVTARRAFMRYAGQGHEIAVALPAGRLAAEPPGLLNEAFEREYRRIYDRAVPRSRVVVVSFAVMVASVALAPSHRPHPVEAAEPVRPAAEPYRRGRWQRIRDPFTGAPCDWSVLDRATLPAGAVFAGPAIIVEDDSSTLAGPGWNGRVDGVGNIVLDRLGAA